jgi:DNA-binding transcriptional LysR family regulator
LQIAQDHAKAAGRGEAGYLATGFYTSLSAGNLRASLVEYGRRFPQVEISTVEASRTRLFDGIQNGAVDIAIVTGEPASDRDRSMILWSERIIVALPEDHPLAANEIIYWTDLKRERFLLSERDPGPEIQDILVAKLSSPGDSPALVRLDVSPENIKSLVGAGRGVSLMSDRRDHLRAVAQRIEVVSPSEVRILGTKTELLRTLVAAAGVESAAAGVHSFIPKWRTRHDSNV